MIEILLKSHRRPLFCPADCSLFQADWKALWSESERRSAVTECTAQPGLTASVKAVRVGPETLHYSCSISGWSHTPSIAFRHLPPKEGCRKPVLGVWVGHTLRPSLSGTFLQTMPDLVTPLKGHSLSPRNCPPTRSVPSERFGY